MRLDFANLNKVNKFKHNLMIIYVIGLLCNLNIIKGHFLENVFHFYNSDLESGVSLLLLLEGLTGMKLKYNKMPSSNKDKLENLSYAMEFMSAEGINLAAMCEYLILFHILFYKS